MSIGRNFLGPYRLVKIVRTGQHCDVWEATKDPDPNRIAVKVMLEKFVNDRSLIKELQREAEVGVGLEHPAIIEIYEFNSDYGLPFLAMELFNAKNVKQELREQPQRVAHYATEIITQAIEGLGYLHDHGWVHCDVKPDNFLMSETGELKLIDFSIAEKMNKGGGLLAKLFGGKSKIKGTRSYMSPEQIRNKALDGRSDIYGLGCTMYELLAGKPPFSGTSPDDLLMKHLQAAIPPLAVANEGVTPEFSELVQKTMAKDPKKRPSSMYNLLREFQSMRVFRTGKKPPLPEAEASAE